MNKLRFLTSIASPYSGGTCDGLECVATSVGKSELVSVHAIPIGPAAAKSLVVGIRKPGRTKRS